MAFAYAACLFAYGFVRAARRIYPEHGVSFLLVAADHTASTNGLRRVSACLRRYLRTEVVALHEAYDAYRADDIDTALMRVEQGAVVRLAGPVLLAPRAVRPRCRRPVRSGARRDGSDMTGLSRRSRSEASPCHAPQWHPDEQGRSAGEPGAGRGGAGTRGHALDRPRCAELPRSARRLAPRLGRACFIRPRMLGHPGPSE